MKNKFQITLLFIFLFTAAFAQKRALYFNNYNVGTDQMAQALTNVGWTVTSTADDATFQTLIATPSNYDVVIYFAQSSGADATSVADLVNFVNSGKKGIYCDYTGSFGSSVGVQYTGNNNRRNVLATDSRIVGRLTTNPFSIADIGWGIYTTGMNVITGGTSLAKFTANNESAMALTLNNNLIVFGFFTDVVSSPEIFEAAFDRLFPTLTLANFNNSICLGTLINANILNDTIYAANNTFTAQLSDMNGTFTTPTTLATLNDSIGGAVSFLVSDTFTNGSGYRIRVVASNPAKVGDTIDVSLNSNPILSGPADTTICSGLALQLSASSNQAGTIEWTFSSSSITGNSSGSGNTITRTLTNPSSTVSDSFYYYLATTNTGTGCSNVDTSKVIVHPNPDVTNISSSRNPVYLGYTPYTCADLTATATNGSGNYSYSWTPSGTGNPLHICPTNCAWYKVTVTDGNGCMDTMSFRQNVLDARSPYAGRVLICYQYPRRPPNTYTLNILPTQVSYYQSLGATLGACGASNCNITNNKRIIEDFTELEGLYKVYPNPVNAELTIEFFNMFTENVTIELIDMTGKAVRTIYDDIVIEGELSRIHINASDIPNGIYMVRYISNSDVRVNKIQIIK